MIATWLRMKIVQVGACLIVLLSFSIEARAQPMTSQQESVVRAFFQQHSRFLAACAHPTPEIVRREVAVRGRRVSIDITYRRKDRSRLETMLEVEIDAHGDLSTIEVRKDTALLFGAFLATDVAKVVFAEAVAELLRPETASKNPKQDLIVKVLKEGMDQLSAKEICEKVVAWHWLNGAQSQFLHATSTQSPVAATVKLCYKGTIDGRLPFSMELDRRETSLSGSYYYDKYGSANRLRLGGSTEQGGVLLNEFDDRGRMTGIFRGMLVGGTRIRGQWSSPDGSRSMSFVADKVSCSDR